MPSGVTVCVDPYSTGGELSVELSSRGYDVVALWTHECAGLEDHVNANTKKWIATKGYLAEVKEEEGSLKKTAEALIAACKGKPPLAVLCGGESGVKLCDQLTEYMKLRGNGTAGGKWDNRRDKMVQQNALRDTGVRAVRGLDGVVWEGPIASFVDTESFPVVVKPVESAGSEGVKLCKSKKEAEDHFHLLMNSQRAIGSAGAAVCIQEFLKGTEYVVDQVSKDGEHKTMMVWQYDKRPRNGSQFVYFGMVPVDPTSATAQWLIQYTRCALNAIDFKNGASHSEIMMTKGGPCLVEINCRCHGGNYAWGNLAKMLTGGYNQVTASVDAYLDDEAWGKIPGRPCYPFKGSGCNIMFVSYVEGKVVGTPGYEIIKKLLSFDQMDEDCPVGSNIMKTIDLFTSTGQCILSHPDPAVVEADIKTIRKLENTNKMFDVEGLTDADLPRESKFERMSAVRNSLLESPRESMMDRMGEQHANALLMAQSEDYEAQLKALGKKQAYIAGGAAAAIAVLGGSLLMALKK